MLLSSPSRGQVTADLPEAFSVLGFAFFIQPMMMPLLHEMPAGPRGVALTSHAVYIVVMGIAMAVYGIVGTSAAARYGLATQGNVLVNQWLGGVPEGVMDAVMTVYLSISIPPMQVRFLVQAPFSRLAHLRKCVMSKP